MVSGSEMMEILSYTHLPLAFDKIVQFDGIYRITAEVKDIVRVEDHSCLAWLTNSMIMTILSFLLNYGYDSLKTTQIQVNVRFYFI